MAHYRPKRRHDVAGVPTYLSAHHRSCAAYTSSRQSRQNKRKVELLQCPALPEVGYSLNPCMIIRPQWLQIPKCVWVTLVTRLKSDKRELGAHIVLHKSPQPMINSYLMATAIVCEGGAFFHYCLFPPLLGRDNWFLCGNKVSTTHGSRLRRWFDSKEGWRDGAEGRKEKWRDSGMELEKKK